MKSLELNIVAGQVSESKASIPNYSREDFKDEMIERMGLEVYDLCGDLDHIIATFRGYGSSRLKIDNKMIDAALEAYGENHGMGRFADYLYREMEKRDKK